MATGEAESEEKGNLRHAVLSLPPLHAIDDLLSVGVCVRCIFRLFGVRGLPYSCSSLTTSVLHSLLEEQNIRQNDSSKNEWCLSTSRESDNNDYYCCICLGVLQLACLQDQEIRESCKETTSVDYLTSIVAGIVKKENHQIDEFSLEVSLPPVISANERAVWLYMRRRYESEDWFKDNFLSEHLSVKDALRLSITTALENHMNAKCGTNSFHIRLTYTHSEASIKLQSCLSNGRGCKKREIEGVDNESNHGDSYKRTSKDDVKHPHNESDAVIHRALDGMQDNDFSELFKSPPEKASTPCQLRITCFRMPIYIGGRYLKFSRKVSQSRWMIDDERMGEASVEEIVGDNVCSICRGDSYKFHAAGREDIDVRMLGSGRPFLVEVPNARYVPSSVDIQEIAEKINNSVKKYVRVRNLKLVGSEGWAMMREGESEKQKQYAALVWISRPLTNDDLQIISSLKDMEIFQKTPVRVLHRRSPLERKRIIHWMMVEKVSGSSQYFLLHLCTQAGTYIKEFVHGDLGRTQPSMGSILGCKAEILQLDVTDVKMDSFN
ncbi:uncharacterized protein [Typha latifolia]|uniref:uncharacterized protein n=1 Tax=Typha latifolia TaxID=4733 RepID=UPI003C2D68BB